MADKPTLTPPREWLKQLHNMCGPGRMCGYVRGIPDDIWFVDWIRHIQQDATKAALSEKEKRDRDMLLSGTGIMKDGKHIPAHSIRYMMCSECEKYPCDPPSKLCPGCQAYREHQQ